MPPYKLLQFRITTHRQSQLFKILRPSAF